MRTFFLLLLILPLAAAAATPPAESFDRIDAAFPDFEFDNPAGEAVKISDFRGKVVVVKLWATWCSTCRAKWPAHQALYNRLKSETDVEMITLSVFEDPEVSRAWVEARGYDVPLYVNLINNRGAVKVADAADYFIKGTPMVFLIDREGILRKKAIGSAASISEADIRDLL